MYTTPRLSTAVPVYTVPRSVASNHIEASWSGFDILSLNLITVRARCRTHPRRPPSDLVLAHPTVHFASVESPPQHRASLESRPQVPCRTKPLHCPASPPPWSRPSPPLPDRPPPSTPAPAPRCISDRDQVSDEPSRPFGGVVLM